MGEKLQFTELDQYLFGQGTHYDVYRKLGAHPVKPVSYTHLRAHET